MSRFIFDEQIFYEFLIGIVDFSMGKSSFKFEFFLA